MYYSSNDWSFPLQVMQRDIDAGAFLEYADVHDKVSMPYKTTFKNFGILFICSIFCDSFTAQVSRLCSM